ncbi:hypothetical protein TNCV_4841031 [Trichonephila clavipes]|uniref:Uncharacterized protein n=1 Tax=Trichonephila clavipes TaxID=2585209 RepID=A0A8X6WJM3_TRICX|nr:hypothetical protein TNCV_4841031 [Trichonephila clavipes]
MAFFSRKGVCKDPFFRKLKTTKFRNKSALRLARIGIIFCISHLTRARQTAADRQVDDGNAEKRKCISGLGNHYSLSRELIPINYFSCCDGKESFS